MGDGIGALLSCQDEPLNRSLREQRVVKAAEAALQDQKYVSPIDVLVGIGWLPPSTVAAWRQGRLNSALLS